MKQSYTAVIQQDEGWWIGWIQDLPMFERDNHIRTFRFRCL